MSCLCVLFSTVLTWGQLFQPSLLPSSSFLPAVGLLCFSVARVLPWGWNLKVIKHFSWLSSIANVSVLSFLLNSSGWVEGWGDGASIHCLPESWDLLSLSHKHLMLLLIGDKHSWMLVFRKFIQDLLAGIETPFTQDEISLWWKNQT